MAPQPLLNGTSFITGAGSGIGQHIALSFAENGISNLALTDLDGDKLQETAAKIKELALNVQVELITMDVASEEAVAQCAEDGGAVWWD